MEVAHILRAFESRLVGRLCGTAVELCPAVGGGGTRDAGGDAMDGGGAVEDEGTTLSVLAASGAPLAGTAPAVAPPGPRRADNLRFRRLACICDLVFSPLAPVLLPMTIPI